MPQRRGVVGTNLVNAEILFLSAAWRPSAIDIAFDYLMLTLKWVAIIRVGSSVIKSPHAVKHRVYELADAHRTVQALPNIISRLCGIDFFVLSFHRRDRVSAVI